MASIDSSQIEAMKQPFVDSLFNILDACRQRQITDEQSGKQTKVSSIWHPIVGHVRGKTSAITVFVIQIDLFYIPKTLRYFSSNQEIVQRVIVQYKYLWSKSFVNMLFESIPSGNPSSSTTIAKKETSKAICFLFDSIDFFFSDIIRAKFEKLFGSKTPTDKLTTDELTQSICRITTLYQKLIQTLTELRLQILCGKIFLIFLINFTVEELFSSFVTR